MGEHLPCKQGVMSSNLTISIRVLGTESGKRVKTGISTLKTEYRISYKKE